MMKKYRSISLLFIIFFFTSSCSSIPFFGKGKERENVVQYALANKGIKYKWGGNNPKEGFDCSGLVYYVYLKAGYKNIPRTTQGQQDYGSKVRFSSLKKGDLVFFNLSGKRKSFFSFSKKIEHVGIYIGSGNFIHAPSTGKNVRIDSLNNNFWKKKHLFTRRII